MTPVLFLSCRIQHIFDENTVPGGGVVYKDMSNGTDEFSVLYNWTAAHE